MKGVHIPEEMLALAKVMGVNHDFPVAPERPRVGLRPGPSALPPQFEKNTLEADYAAYLDTLVLAGEILRWDFQSMQFVLGVCDVERAGRVGKRRVTFRPDFIVYRKDGVIELHETKGYMEEDARIKLVLMAALYPFEIRLVKRRKGGGFATTTYRG